MKYIKEEVHIFITFRFINKIQKWCFYQTWWPGLPTIFKLLSYPSSFFNAPIMPFLFNCVSNSIRFIKIKKCNAIPTALVRVRLSLIRKLLHDWTNLYAYPSNAKLGGSMRLDLPSWSMCDDTNQSASRSQLHVDISVDISRYYIMYIYNAHYMHAPGTA